MTRRLALIKYIVAAGWLALMPANLQAADLDGLFAQLRDAPPERTDMIEAEITNLWENSGSAAMDLLMRRGNDALQDGAPDLALDHFSALVDHAPDYAQGYFARATAYYLLDMTGPALADLGEVLAREPRHFEAMRGLAAIMEELDRPADALALQRMVQDMMPQSYQVQDEITRLQLQLEGLAL
jgi:tetratricopeptide (TPR) repeat protein